MLRTLIACSLVALTACEEQPRQNPYLHAPKPTPAPAPAREPAPMRVAEAPEPEQPAQMSQPESHFYDSPWFWLAAGQMAYHTLKPSETPRPRIYAPTHHHHSAPAARPSYRAPTRTPPPRAYRPAPSRTPRSPGYSARPAPRGR